MAIRFYDFDSTELFGSAARKRLLQRCCALKTDGSTWECHRSIDSSVAVAQCVCEGAIGGGGPYGEPVAAAGEAVGESSGDGNSLAVVGGCSAVDGHRAREGETRERSAGH
jgi:hypothetical protein